MQHCISAMTHQFLCCGRCKSSRVPLSKTLTKCYWIKPFPTLVLESDILLCRFSLIYKLGEVLYGPCGIDSCGVPLVHESSQDTGVLVNALNVANAWFREI